MKRQQYCWRFLSTNWLVRAHKKALVLTRAFIMFREGDYFFAARSKDSMISAFADAASSQPSTLTHLPFSKSL